MPITVSQTINEKSTCPLRFTLTDYDGNAVPVSAIDTATMTVTIYGTETVVNSRTNIDVKSSFNSEGEFEFLLTKDDNAIIAPISGVSQEVHLFTFKIKTLSNIYLNEEVAVTVVNLQMVE